MEVAIARGGGSERLSGMMFVNKNPVIVRPLGLWELVDVLR